ncbi:RluA family pseudouridine synthase [Pseudohongiella sp. SYSU M77423]|uniref:RluA family pseudouridine synthase n=1 Tax=Pseudohongiella sp. SYSU M77423 TaxID=3042312 RepID=UPI0024815227|nr:RluA family pseudouridine synthase [Pseudohongiella sp. SYSU M77423]MDH7943151.1 RluA family pseudouridine synthase [Pseudohongiella sp. SYSU M77423]
MNDQKHSPQADRNYQGAATTGVQYISVGEHATGQRLDNFLMSRLRGLPKSHLYRLIRKGEIRINKKRCKPDSRVTEGDVVRVAPLRLSVRDAPVPPGAELQRALQQSILYEDDHLLLLNKPAGMPVHAGTGTAAGVIEALRYMAGEGGYRELAHRLDKETSGCLLVAKSAIALKTLQVAFKKRQVSKIYQAIVHGSWSADLTQVDAPLLRVQPQQGERIVKTDNSGKSAQTEFRLLKDYGTASLIEARPLTGRTHQIRVHCQQAGHPILGDDKYTYHRPHSFGKLRFLCLHASALSLDHPVSGQTLAVSAPLRSAMQELLTQLDESRA